MTLKPMYACSICGTPVCSTSDSPMELIAKSLAHLTMEHAHDIAESCTREEVKDPTHVYRIFAMAQQLWARRN